MRGRTVPPAGTPPRHELLRGIYERQFRELAPLRRHVLSLLPLSGVGTIFEPGCGTGLLTRELSGFTGIPCTGMDIDGDILPRGDGFILGDAEKDPLQADLYVTGFFFSSLRDPAGWLKRARTGLFCVFSEYDYMRTRERPFRNLSERLRSGLEKDGLFTEHGGRLDEYFGRAGFTRLSGGHSDGGFRTPDAEFLSMHVPNLEKELPLMSWRVVWGIWRKAR